jgi:hypothetical protein
MAAVRSRPVNSKRRPLMEMLYGAIDIHKHVFQAAVFDP